MIRILRKKSIALPIATIVCGLWTGSAVFVGITRAQEPFGAVKPATGPANADQIILKDVLKNEEYLELRKRIEATNNRGSSSGPASPSQAAGSSSKPVSSTQNRGTSGGTLSTPRPSTSPSTSPSIPAPAIPSSTGASAAPATAVQAVAGLPAAAVTTVPTPAAPPPPNGNMDALANADYVDQFMKQRVLGNPEYLKIRDRIESLRDEYKDSDVPTPVVQAHYATPEIPKKKSSSGRFANSRKSRNSSQNSRPPETQNAPSDQPPEYHSPAPAAERPNENSGGDGGEYDEFTHPDELLASMVDPGRGGGHSASAPPASEGGFFKKLFSKNSKADTPPDPEVATTLDQFPHADQGHHLKPSKAELQAEDLIGKVHQEYGERIDRMTASDLRQANAADLPEIPRDFESSWYRGIRGGMWPDEERLAVSIEDAYARALMNSNQVKVFSYIPLIRETGIQEAKGAFDTEIFADGRYDDSDEPTSSLLTTGETGRFLQEEAQAEAGLRKRFGLGTEVSLSNRFSSLSNNSEFLDPNPQSGTELVLSVVQPLLRGGGYKYNKAALKIAKIDAGMAAAEYIRQMETHLLEVNRAYWGVYLARAGYLLRNSLSNQTSEILNKLEERSDEATASELLRARSELSKRRTAVTRSEMAVRNAEERLRALINDPDFPIGGSGEFIPTTRPVMSPPRYSVKGSAREAVDNRPEIAQAFGQLRAAAIRNEIGKHERLPQLDALAESGLAGLDSGRYSGGAYDDMFGSNAGWMVGLRFSQPWEQNFSKAREQRRRYELMQQADNVRSSIDNVLLESVVAYRELMTSYRDMQGRHQEVVATREEVRALEERLEVDAGDGQTIAYRLQLILDAIERNQVSEEQFLVSVVSYNIAFSLLERAKGTLLKQQDVTIERQADPDWRRMERLRAVTPETASVPE